jgi:uncharacterized repeat protein (TIGR03803 family)
MQNRQQWLSWVAVGLAVAMSGLSARAQTNFTVLHSFNDSTTDGWNPCGQPVVVGTTLSGYTYFGGNFSNGAVFQMNTNSFGFSLLHSFEGGTNGANPSGSLVFNDSDTSFYGMTFNGGANGEGVVFRMNTDGIAYTVLHAFAGGDNDGAFPNGTPTVSGSTLYGMTTGGGTNYEGVVFSMNTDGSGFTVLHSFGGGTNDSAYPSEGVVLGGSTLYGTTYFGGTNDSGVVFAVDADGNNFKLLHDFAGGTNDGAYPAGLLTLSGSSLYGVTLFGGTNNEGTVFTVNTDGTGYTLLHHFVGGTNDGAYPEYGSLAITTNSLIYGATINGGLDDQGVVFRMNADGTGFTILHSFFSDPVFGNPNDGAYPYYGPILSGSTLYGMTDSGGTENYGVLYSLSFLPIVTNIVPVIKISGIGIVTNDVVITWTATGAQTDVVQVTPGDANGGYTNNFVDLSDPIVISGTGTTTTNYVDVGGATNAPARYYRVRATP